MLVTYPVWKMQTSPRKKHVLARLLMGTNHLVTECIRAAKPEGMGPEQRSVQESQGSSLSWIIWYLYMKRHLGSDKDGGLEQSVGNMVMLGNWKAVSKRSSHAPPAAGWRNCMPVKLGNLWSQGLFVSDSSDLRNQLNSYFFLSKPTIPFCIH